MRPFYRRKLPIIGMILAAGGIALASGCRHHTPEQRVAYVSEKIASKLDFNDQQKALLKDITDEVAKDMKEARERKKASAEEIKSMISGDVLNKTRVKELMKERQAFIDSKMDKYIDKVAALHATLTAEQKKEILEKIEKFQNHWD